MIKIVILFMVAWLGIYFSFLWDERAHPSRNVTVSTPQGDMTGELRRRWTGDYVLTDIAGRQQTFPSAPNAIENGPPTVTVDHSGLSGVLDRCNFVVDHWRFFFAMCVLAVGFGYASLREWRQFLRIWHQRNANT